jgi:MFS family permease
MTRRVVAIAVSAQVAVSALQQGLPVLAVVLPHDLHMSVTTVGWMLGSVGASCALSVWGWGVLADRLGDRAVLLIGLPAAAVALVAAATAARAGSSVGVLAALIAAGTGAASGTAALSKALVTRTPSASWGRVLGLRQAAVPAGGLLAALLLVRGSTQASGAFLGLAILFLVAAAAVALGLGALPGSNRSPAGNRGWQPPAGLRALLLGTTCYGVTQTGALVWSAVAWRQIGYPGPTAATLLVFVQASTILVRLVLGRRADGRGAEAVTLQRIGACTAALLALTAVARGLQVPPIVQAGALVAACLAASSWNGLAFTVSTRLAASVGASHQLGRIHGAQNTALFTAVGLTPPLAGVVLQHAGLAVMWSALAGFSVIGAAAHARLPNLHVVPAPQSPAPAGSPTTTRNTACTSAVAITSS